MTSKEQLNAWLVQSLRDKGLLDQAHRDRLLLEIKELDKQNEFDYFVDLAYKKIKFGNNENNLLVPYLLGLVDEFDINIPPKYEYGDFPDIDVDFVDDVRDYLKNEWAPREFGSKNVCNIGNYTTFGIKSSLIDMARVYGQPRDEILGLTTQLGLKDDDGKPLTWEKALESDPRLKAYCDANKELADMAHRLIDRNRGRGKHAGGLIISRTPIDKLVPLCTDNDGLPVSSWVEGLHSQDLQPVGLVKYDLLGITNLKQIARIGRLVKQRHGLDHISNLPGQSDWSDTSYLNDKAALELANEGKLKCIFQFDSPGIRSMTKEGGVDTFDDLVAYSALYRPGPLGCFSIGSLVNIKGGQKPIEQLKNWHDEIAYVNNEGNISYTKKFVLWKTGKKKVVRVKTKSGKVFMCTPDHRFLTEDGTYKTIENLKSGKISKIKECEMQDFEWDEIISIDDAGEANCYDITLLESDCYLDEPNFITNGTVVHNCGMHQHYMDRKRGKEEYSIHPLLQPSLGVTYGVMVFQEQVMQVLNVVGNIPLKDCEIVRKAISKKKEKVFAKYKIMFLENGQKNLGWALEEVQALFDQVVSFSEYGFNRSHAVAYNYLTSRLLYLKAHYPIEFFAGILESETNEDKIKEYKLEAERFGIQVNPVDLNKSSVNFKIIGTEIYIGFSNIKGIGPEVAQRIVDQQPYSGFEDFIKRFGTDANVLKPLIGLKVFPEGEKTWTIMPPLLVQSSEDISEPIVTLGSVTPKSINGRVVLFEFADFYKEQLKKREDRNKRNAKGLDGRVEELRFLLPDNLKDQASHDWFLQRLDMSEDALNAVPDLPVKNVWKLLQKYKRSYQSFQEKVKKDDSVVLTDFVPTGEINEELRVIYEDDLTAAELKFYGFGWKHLLEKSPDFEPNWAFSDLARRIEESPCRLIGGTVIVQVIELPKLKTSKKGTTTYFTVRVEDSEWQQATVTVWDVDYERFKEEFEFWESESRRGSLLKLKLEIPQPPYKNYTFHSFPKATRHKEMPKEKSDDLRLVLMRRP